MNQTFKKWGAWICVVGWMGVIFYLSHQPADESSTLSTGIVQSIVSAIEIITTISLSDTEWMHYIIRKSAHLFAYFLLAILFMNAFKQSGQKRMMQVMMTLLGTILYATSDEIHQLYIVGRSGEVKDVLIDTTGATIGILVFIIVEIFVVRNQGKQKVKER